MNGNTQQEVQFEVDSVLALFIGMYNESYGFLYIVRQGVGMIPIKTQSGVTVSLNESIITAKNTNANTYINCVLLNISMEL